MDWTLIITGLISALAGGGLASYFNYRLGHKKENTNEFSILLEQYKLLRKDDTEEINSLKNRIKELEDKDLELMLEIQSLKHQLMFFESSHLDIPLPNWLKDTSGKMLFLNKDYEELFLKPRGFSANDYIGQNDFSVWEDEVAKHFIQNDRQVIRTKKPYKWVEEIEIDGKPLYLEVFEYPRKFKDVIIGIGGIVLRVSNEKFELK